MTQQLSPAPEWLKEAVQPQSTCWSAKEGFAKSELGEANWDWDDLSKENNVDDIILCPGCSDSFLPHGFSNGVRAISNADEMEDGEVVTPFAERPANFGESCDACSNINYVTAFIPELGGWISLSGVDAPDDDTWLAHIGELPTRVVEFAQDFELAWAEDDS
jgi:hypothetical protein